MSFIQEYSPFRETLQAVDEHLESEMKAAREKLSAAVVVADDDADPGSGGQGAASSAMGAPTKTISVQLHLFFSFLGEFSHGCPDKNDFSSASSIFFSFLTGSQVTLSRRARR